MGAKRGTSKERLSRLTRYRPNGCLEFQGAIMRDGYGMFRHNGRSRLAHRVAYEIYNNGESPGELDVLHSCDNPRCVNPMHLRLGTHTQNMRDMLRKGRGRGKTGAYEILDDVKAYEIRWYEAMGRRRQDLASEHGVSLSLIAQIVTGKAWPMECHD